MPQAFSKRSLILCMLALLATACGSRPAGHALQQHSGGSVHPAGFQLPDIDSLPGRETLDSRGYLLGENLSSDLNRQNVSTFDGSIRFTPEADGPPLKSKV